MGLLDFRTVLEHDGTHVDARKVDDLERVLQNKTSAVVGNSLIVAGPQILFGFWVSSVSAQFIQLFDLGTLPADTTVPTLSYPVQALSGIAAQWVPGRYFRNGIVICNSSTQHTKTIGSADCLFDLQVL